MFSQIFNDESAVTVIRFSFAAQKTTHINIIRRDMFLDLTLSNNRGELSFILLPTDQSFFIVVKQLFSRSHDRQMDIISADDSLQYNHLRHSRLVLKPLFSHQTRKSV